MSKMMIPRFKNFTTIAIIIMATIVFAACSPSEYSGSDDYIVGSSTGNPSNKTIIIPEYLMPSTKIGPFPIFELDFSIVGPDQDSQSQILQTKIATLLSKANRKRLEGATNLEILVRTMAAKLREAIRQKGIEYFTNDTQVVNLDENDYFKDNLEIKFYIKSIPTDDKAIIRMDFYNSLDGRLQGAYEFLLDIINSRVLQGYFASVSLDLIDDPSLMGTRFAAVAFDDNYTYPNITLGTVRHDSFTDFTSDYFACHKKTYKDNIDGRIVVDFFCGDDVKNEMETSFRLISNNSQEDFFVGPIDLTNRSIKCPVYHVFVDEDYLVTNVSLYYQCELLPIPLWQDPSFGPYRFSYLPQRPGSPYNPVGTANTIFLDSFEMVSTEIIELTLKGVDYFY